MKKHYKTFSRFCLGIGGSLILSSSIAFAQEEKPVDDGLWGQDIFGWIGIVPSKKADIEYRERAPLVVPPSNVMKGLPQPIERGALQNKAGNWPKDPDVLVQKRLEEESRLPRTKTENYEWQKGRPINPDLLRGDNRRITVDNNARAITLPEGSRAANLVSPDKLRKGPKNSKDDFFAGREPARGSLSDPPTGYRKPTGALKTKPKEQVVRKVDEGSPRAFNPR